MIFFFFFLRTRRKFVWEVGSSYLVTALPKKTSFLRTHVLELSNVMIL